MIKSTFSLFFCFYPIKPSTFENIFLIVLFLDALGALAFGFLILFDKAVYEMFFDNQMLYIILLLAYGGLSLLVLIVFPFQVLLEMDLRQIRVPFMFSTLGGGIIKALTCYLFLILALKQQNMTEIQSIDQYVILNSALALQIKEKYILVITLSSIGLLSAIYNIFLLFKIQDLLLYVEQKTKKWEQLVHPGSNTPQEKQSIRLNQVAPEIQTQNTQQQEDPSSDRNNKRIQFKLTQNSNTEQNHLQIIQNEHQEQNSERALLDLIKQDGVPGNSADFRAKDTEARLISE